MTRVDARWQKVECARCHRRYICTPTDDYYDATTLTDGICESCLLHRAGYTDHDIDRGREDPDPSVLAKRPNGGPDEGPNGGP